MLSLIGIGTLSSNFNNSSFSSCKKQHEHVKSYLYIKYLHVFLTAKSIPLVANINFTYPPISMDQVQYINIFQSMWLV